MEFLKDFFNDGTLTFEELGKRVEESGAVKLANLADGAYVGTDKYKALLAQQAETKQQLTQTAAELEAFAALDIPGLQNAAETYRAEAEQAKAEAGEQVRQAQYRMAAMEHSAGLGFSSASAKKAFIDALLEKRLPLENGRLEGFAEFEQEWRSADPDAFASEAAPRFVAPATPPALETGWREKLGRNYLNARQQMPD